MLEQLEMCMQNFLYFTTNSEKHSFVEVKRKTAKVIKRWQIIIQGHGAARENAC